MPDDHYLAEFVASNCAYVAGDLMPYAEFEAAYLDWLRPREPHQWTRRRLVRALNSFAAHFPYGRHNDNRRFVGNLAWTYRRSTKPPIGKRNGRLRRPR